MILWFYALASVFIVSIVSLMGVFILPIKARRLNTFLIYFVSFSVGAMLGDVFIHLLPEVVEKEGFTQNISFYILFGMVSTFVIEKILHIRHEYHANKHIHYPKPLTTLTLFGDGVHNFIDGLIIGASYLVSIPTGVATTFAVVLHEIPQEIGNFGVLIHGGYSKERALFFNFLSALTAVAGTIVALVIGQEAQGSVMFLTSFAAGNFIYIAASDLIPELNKETKVKNSILQFVTFVIGIVAMYLLLFLE